MPTNLSEVGNKAKRTELYRKQKGDKKAAQKDRRKRREREAQELGEVRIFPFQFSTFCLFGAVVCVGFVGVVL